MRTRALLAAGTILTIAATCGCTLCEVNYNATKDEAESIGAKVEAWQTHEQTQFQRLRE